jgi:hypothetical protein
MMIISEIVALTYMPLLTSSKRLSLHRETQCVLNQEQRRGDDRSSRKTEQSPLCPWRQPIFIFQIHSDSQDSQEQAVQPLSKTYVIDPEKEVRASAGRPSSLEGFRSAAAPPHWLCLPAASRRGLFVGDQGWHLAFTSTCSEAMAEKKKRDHMGLLCHIGSLTSARAFRNSQRQG